MRGSINLVTYETEVWRSYLKPDNLLNLKLILLDLRYISKIAVEMMLHLNKLIKKTIKIMFSKLTFITLLLLPGVISP